MTQLVLGRSLVAEHSLEIENADKVTGPFWRFFADYLENDCGIKPGANQANSLYLDTERFAVFRSGLTLRDRQGGLSTCGERFPDQFGIKYRRLEFEKTANEVAGNLFSGRLGRGASICIRSEIEVDHSHPRDSYELRLFDLPDKLQTQISNRVKILKPENLVFKPQFVTSVDRQRFAVYLDPDKPVNFKDSHPLAQPSDEMREKGNWVAIEIARDDKCIYRRPPKGMSIAEILSAPQHKFTGFKRLGVTDDILEREFRAKKSGPKLTDEEFIRCYSGFGVALYEFAEKRSKKEKKSITPLRSKGAIGYDYCARGDKSLRKSLKQVWSTSP